MRGEASENSEGGLALANLGAVAPGRTRSSDARFGKLDIHDQCVKYGETADGLVDYVRGANIAGFVKVADAMMAYGVL